MADQELKIRLELESRGIQSVTDLEKKIREVRKAFKDAAVGSAEFEKSAKELPQLLDLKGKAMERVASSQARMMRSYFQLGTEIRANALPAMTSFSRIIQDAPFGLMGVSNNITMLAEQFAHLRTQAGSTGIALKSMLATLTGPAGFVLLISLVTTLALVFGDKLLKAVGAVREEFKLMASEARSMERFIDTLGRLYGFRRERIGGFSDNRITSEINVRVGFIERLEAAINRLRVEDETASEERKKSIQSELKLLHDRLKQEEMFLDALVSERKERERINQEIARGNQEFDRAIARQLSAGARNLGGAGEVGPLGRAVSPTGLTPDPNFVRSRLEQVKPSFEEFFSFYADKLGGIESAWTASIRTMGGQVSTWFLGAFRRSFNEINSLFEQMVASFTSALLEMAVQAAAYGFLSMLFSGLNFFTTAGSAAVARGGRSLVPGGVNPAEIAGGGKTREMALNKVAMPMGEWRVRGNDLVYVLERTKRSSLGRRG